MRKTLLAVLIVTLLLLTGAIAYAHHQLSHRVGGFKFDSNGVELHYTDEGDGPPVILLHGFAAQSDLNWRNPGLIDVLRQSFRVISLDLRGHGLSGKPHDASAYGLEMVYDIARLMDYLELDRAHVVGYSLGGFIALKFATLYPDRVLTLAPLAAGWEAVDDGKFFAAIERYAERLDAGKGMGPLINVLGEREQHPSTLQTVGVHILTRWLNDRRALVGVMRGLNALAIDEEDLTLLTMPVLSIIGRDDPLLLGVERLQGRLPNHKVLILDDADHISVIRRPELLQALFDFLSEYAFMQ